MGTYESYLAGLLIHLIAACVREHDIGIVLPTDGMLRLAPGLVRIPDVSFISWARLPGGKVPHTPVADLSPDIAIEVISPGNTREEMQQKLRDYFAAKIRQVWYVYPKSREIHVYTEAESATIYTEQQALDGGAMLPGFQLDLRQFFAEHRQGSN